METKSLLENLRQGDVYEAFEAAKSLSKLPRLSPKRIMEVLKETKAVHNREATVYALSYLLRKDRSETLRALLSIVNNVNDNPAVRGQALEGFGIQRPTKKHKLWHEVEIAILNGLRDEAVEVRFWACYAAGTLRMESALPQLKELSRNDVAVYPKWWRVSEEAADAIEWIFGRDTESRVAISNS